MCGGCARGNPGDWVTRAVPDRGARARAAAAVNRLSEGARMRVDAAASGFTVRHPTGRTVVAPTLSAVWDAVLGAGGRVGSAPSAGTGPSAGSAPSAGTGPECRLALLVYGDGGAAPGDGLHDAASAAGVASAWGPDLVLDAADLVASTEVGPAADPAAGLAAVLEPGLGRVLLTASAGTAGAALAAVAATDVRLRATVTAVAAVGDAPGWATPLTGLGQAAVRDVLDGTAEPTVRRPALGLAEAAAWVTGLVRSGATDGQRSTVSVAGGRWLLDAADGHGLAVRPARLAPS